MVNLFSGLFGAPDNDGSLCPYPRGSMQAANWLSCMQANAAGLTQTQLDDLRRRAHAPSMPEVIDLRPEDVRVVDDKDCNG